MTTYADAAHHAADRLAADHARLRDENADLHCRVQELTAERDALREELDWERNMASRGGE